MRKATLFLLGLVGMLCVGSGQARMSDFAAHEAVMDSLSRVHPRLRGRWLNERGLEDFRPARPDGQDSVGLRVIGRWSYGPSYDIDGRVSPAETLVAQARGSGVSLIRSARADSIELELLSDINAKGRMRRVRVQDSLLYVGSSAGLEIWDIADVRSPIRLSWTAVPLNDFSLQDSLAYVIAAKDSFRILSVADPRNPAQLGACRDSGYSVAVTGDLALVGDRWGLYLLDVSDPAAPHRVNSWGSAIDAIATRGALVCVTRYNPNRPGELSLTTLDVSDPRNVRTLGVLNGAGGYDIHLLDTLVFCSGDANDHSLKIVSIADSANPRLLGAVSSPGWGMGVWASGVDRTAFYAAHYVGMEAYDIANTANPVRDTAFGAAGSAVDIDVQGSLAAVANDMTGLSLLDVSDPTRPVRLGVYDTAGTRPTMQAAVLDDSFAYVGWSVTRFVSLDISDPTQPKFAGSCLPVANRPEAMVLHDTLVYVAEQGALRVVNVARPREPEMIGSCGLLGYSARGLVLQDTIAYVANVTALLMVNVADPTNPRVVGRTWDKYASDVDVVDTIAYIVGADYSVWSLSVANPAAPRVLSSAYLGRDCASIVVVGSLAYAGENRIHIVDVSDPGNLRPLGRVNTPGWTHRLYYAAPYLYACYGDGGIGIYETTHVGISDGAEGWPKVRNMCILPNPTRGVVRLPSVEMHQMELRVWDVTGKQVMRRQPEENDNRPEVDLTPLPAGMYFLELRSGTVRLVGKVVRQ